MDPMGRQWHARITAALGGSAARGGRAVRHGPAVGAGLLALAACGQALWYAVMLARDGLGGPAGVNNSQVVLNALPLCLLALASTVPLAFPRPLAAAVTACAATVVMLGGFQRATVAGMIAVVLAVFRLGRRGEPARRRDGYVAVGLAAPFLALALAWPQVPEVLLAFGVPAAAAAGIAVRAGRSALLESEHRSALEDTLTEHMARGERARIARELHDVVAHHISMIAVQAETARLTTPGLPATGAARFSEIGSTARAGLTEMRRLLGVLREDVAAGDVGERQPQPGLPQVPALVDVARDAAISGAVRLIMSGAVTSYDPGTELVAYRIVQEALTNARRHAPGAAVDVELMFGDDLLRLRVRDNGPGPAASAGGENEGTSGHGLVGMRERAATVGGWVRTGAAPGGGFLVEAALPAKPDELMTSADTTRRGGR
jgi:signal transduction histidine kinase